VSVRVDRALLPGALVAGSPPHGTGDHVYAIISEQLPFGGPKHGLRLTLLVRDRQPAAELVDGVLFEGGAASLWRP
jgi:hypothetical protein